MFKKVFMDQKHARTLALGVIMIMASLAVGYLWGVFFPMTSMKVMTPIPAEVGSSSVLTDNTLSGVTALLPVVVEDLPQADAQTLPLDLNQSIIQTSSPRTIDLFPPAEAVLGKACITSFTYCNGDWYARVQQGESTYQVRIPECILDDVSIGDSISICTYGNTVVTFAGLDAKSLL